MEGREVITEAPSLSAGPVAGQPGLLAARDNIDGAIDVLAAATAPLDRRLSRAAAGATIHADRVACEETAGAARRIHQLIARGDDGAGESR